MWCHCVQVKGDWRHVYMRKTSFTRDRHLSMYYESNLASKLGQICPIWDQSGALWMVNLPLLVASLVKCRSTRHWERQSPHKSPAPGEWLHLTVNWELIIHNALRMTSSRALVHSSLKQRTDRLTPWSGLEWRFGTNIEPKCINLIWKCLGFVQFRAFLNVFGSKSVITESLTISHQLDQALS